MRRLLISLTVATVALAGCSPADDVTVTPTPGPTANAVPQATTQTTTPTPDRTPTPGGTPGGTPTATPTATPTPAEPVAPSVADDPAGLAAQLVEAERGIRDDTTPPVELARLGHLQQVAYRRMAIHPEWRDGVLARVPDDLRSVVAANADATAALRAMVTPREELPAWRIVEPAAAEDLLVHYREAEAAFGVPWAYLAAIHLVETRMGRIRGTSVAGAQGPMQFMPGTWEAYGDGDVNDNRDAILAAGRYLHANGAPADMDNALFRYNRDRRYVAAITAYAEQMLADERAYRGYYRWEVYFLTPGGDRWLPVGYGSEG